ncbi:MAG: hypothetical protein QGF94_04970 [Candidatus Thalassarchaeaceae archaeon]|nr:hypothetical protein [Candidatus Thalassarchaeaceae archaeon]
MRPHIVAWTVRAGLLAIEGILFLFLWYGTGAERAPIGLLISMVIAGLAGLWWMELKVQQALSKALGEE